MFRIVRQASKTKSLFKVSRYAAPIRCFAGKAPESFFDEDDELEKERFDFKLATANGGIQNLVTGHSGEARGSLAGMKVTINDLQAQQDLDGVDMEEEDIVDEEESERQEATTGIPAPGHLPESANIASRMADNSTSAYVPPEYANHSMDWQDANREEEEPEELESFVSRTDERSMPIDKQGLVACPGRRQRRGTKPQLKCHLIDIDELHYTDVVTLSRFLSPDSEILGRRLSGLCAKCQRNVARTVRRSRNLGLLSHLGAFHIVDADPTHDSNQFNFHRSPHDIPAVVSKTII